MNTDKTNRTYVSEGVKDEVHVESGTRLRIGSAENGGAFELFEIDGPASPPPHVHRNHDECFYIIEGIFTFVLGTDQVDARAGSVVFIPHGMRHAFTHSVGARALFLVNPAGLEGYFREIEEGRAAGYSEADLRAKLAGKYDSWLA